MYLLPVVVVNTLSILSDMLIESKNLRKMLWDNLLFLKNKLKKNL
jgi:hypothetical protein